MKIFKLLEAQYDGYVQSIKTYLSNTLANYNISFNNSSIFGQIITVIGATCRSIMSYIEDALVEQNVHTAQRKKSLLSLATLSGYQPHLGKAAGVMLKINFKPSNHKYLSVVLNNKTKVTCFDNGAQYNIMLPQESVVLSLDKNNGTQYFYAVQGMFETQSFVSTGGKYYTQNLKYNSNIDLDYLDVYINDVKWTRMASFYDMEPMAEQYALKVGYAGGVDIIFGNGPHGKPLNNEDLIRVEYLLHTGESGNIQWTTDNAFSFNNPLYDVTGEEVDGNVIFDLRPESSEAVTAGSNGEDTASIRQMIGLNSRSLVLADVQNYKELINKFSFCGYNRTWSEKGSMVIKSLIMRNYKMNLSKGLDYFNLNEDDFKLTEFQKISIMNHIKNNGNQMAGITYAIVDPSIYKYAIYMYVKLKSANTNQDYISSRIKEIVGRFFASIHSDIFIPKSDIIHAIKSNIQEIDSVNIYLLSEKNETAIQQGWYEKIEEKYDPSTNSFVKSTIKVTVPPNTNPNLGFDNHGNIYLDNNEQFPVLMGGWDFLNKQGQEVTIVEPLNIFYE